MTKLPNMPKDEKPSKALDTSQAFQNGADMSSREQEILNHLISTTGFEVKKEIWRSSYYGTKQIGAVHYSGLYKGQESVLKIQGVKPDTSEGYMIDQFSKQNRSQIIRPPKIFDLVPWTEENQYEALLMEFVTGPKVIESKRLQTADNIHEFYRIYQEYRQNCLPTEPWLASPGKQNLEEILEKIIANADRAFAEDPRRHAGDRELATKAYKVLENFYGDTPMEFLHGHFSTEDLLRSGEQVVVFSNLFWKYRPPLFDAVFGYHWFMMELNHVEGITPEQVEEQRKLWQEEMFAVPFIAKSDRNRKLVKAVLLERAVAGFLLDSLLVDKNKPIASYLTNSCREETRKFIEELS